jgi:hypothetical protein
MKTIKKSWNEEGLMGPMLPGGGPLPIIVGIVVIFVIMVVLWFTGHFWDVLSAVGMVLGGWFILQLAPIKGWPGLIIGAILIIVGAVGFFLV